ncbi:hypothetical protein JCM16303_000187 [Sporobolomyces ruberrimus]
MPARRGRSVRVFERIELEKMEKFLEDLAEHIGRNKRYRTVKHLPYLTLAGDRPEDNAEDKAFDEDEDRDEDDEDAEDYEEPSRSRLVSSEATECSEVVVRQPSALRVAAARVC